MAGKSRNLCELCRLVYYQNKHIPNCQHEQFQTLKRSCHISVQVNTWTEGKRQPITISAVKDEQALLVLTGISSLVLFYNIAISSPTLGLNSPRGASHSAMKMSSCSSSRSFITMCLFLCSLSCLTYTALQRQVSLRRLL